MTGRWFSPGTPVSSTNKSDCHDITEILLKVALSTITLTHNSYQCCSSKLIHHCSSHHFHCFSSQLFCHSSFPHSFLIDVPRDLFITLPHSSCISVPFTCLVFVLCFSISGLVIIICSAILNKSIEFIWITQVRFRGVRVAQSLVFYVLFCK